MRFSTAAAIALLPVLSALAADPPPVTVEATAGENPSVQVGVDLLAGRSADGTRERTWGEAVSGHFSRNKWRWLLAVASAVVVDRVAENNNELWHRSSSSSSRGTTHPLPDTASGGITLIVGDNNQSVNVVVVAPVGGSASGADAHSGSGRVIGGE